MQIEIPETKFEGLTVNRDLTEAVIRCAEALESIAKKIKAEESASDSEGSDHA